MGWRKERGSKLKLADKEGVQSCSVDFFSKAMPRTEDRGILLALRFENKYSYKNRSLTLSSTINANQILHVFFELIPAY